MTKHLVRLGAIALYVVWVIWSESQPEVAERKEAEYLHSILSNVQEKVYVIKPADRNRLVDCTDEVSNGGPLHIYQYLRFYDGLMDPLNGFISSNDWPVYVHARGLESIHRSSKVFMGFRGDTAGVHRSLITPRLYSIFNEYQDTALFFPASYIRLENGSLQSVCHKRHYRSDRIYIGDKWPSMIEGGSWRIYSKVLQNHAHIFMFSYSNGGLARDEYIKTDPLYPDSITITNNDDFIQQYSRATRFKDHRVQFIDGMMDVESIFAGPAMLDLSKYLYEEVNNNPEKFYYSACRIDSFSSGPVVSLIRGLRMIGYELSNGVVRYQNAMRNIVMDIVPHNGQYSYGHIDLRSQTTYLPDRRVTIRFETDHFKILGYATAMFKQLAEERGFVRRRN